MTKRKCPWCGNIVFVDVENKQVSHQAPECSEFLAAVRAAGGDEGRAEIRSNDTGELIARNGGSA